MGSKHCINMRYFRHYFPTVLSFLLGVLFSALLCYNQTPTQCTTLVTPTSAVDAVQGAGDIAEPATNPGVSIGLETAAELATVTVLTTEPPTTVIPATKEPYPPLVDKEGIVITPRSCPKNVFLLILVVTSSRNFAARKAIRRSWGEGSWKMNTTTGSSESFCIVYVLGSDDSNDRLIVREAKRYRDILRGGFEDVYRKNEEHAVKTLLGFKWSTSSCKAKFILKASSESFINVPQLISLLKTKTSELDGRPVEGLYTGFCHGHKIGGATVVRNPASPWFISENEWSDNKLPPYASGMGIILSFDVVERIVELSLQEKLIHIDDVYLGIMATKLSITCQDDSSRFDTSYTTMLTECEDLTFCVLGGVPSKDMFYLNQNIKNLKEIC